MPPGLQVTSGIGTVSGIAAVNALPVTLYGASGDVITDFSGALNVNISGGTLNVSANVSGNVVRIASASGNVITDFSGALNVNISGGTISTTPPAYQSGTLVGISGGQLALSGLIVEVSGQFVFTSGGGSPNISGGVTVSGGVQVSGSITALSGSKINIVSASGNIITDFSGALNVNISGGTIAANVSGNQVNFASGVTLNLSGLNVTISGQSVQITSGGVIPVSLVSGSAGAMSGLVVSNSGNYFNIAASGAPLFHSSGWLNVNTQHQWPSYMSNNANTNNTFSGIGQGAGASQLNIAAIIASGNTAAQSGIVVELKTIEITITGSGAGGQTLAFYLISVASGAGPFAPIKMFQNNPASIITSSDTSAGKNLSGTIQALQGLLTIQPLTSGVLTRETLTHNFSISDGFQPPTFGSGYGFMITMSSGTANGVYNMYWIEKYLS